MLLENVLVKKVSVTYDVADKQPARYAGEFRAEAAFITKNKSNSSCYQQNFVIIGKERGAPSQFFSPCKIYKIFYELNNIFVL